MCAIRQLKRCSGCQAVRELTRPARRTGASKCSETAYAQERVTSTHVGQNQGSRCARLWRRVRVPCHQAVSSDVAHEPVELGCLVVFYGAGADTEARHCAKVAPLHLRLPHLLLYALLVLLLLLLFFRTVLISLLLLLLFLLLPSGAATSTVFGPLLIRLLLRTLLLLKLSIVLLHFILQVLLTSTFLLQRKLLHSVFLLFLVLSISTARSSTSLDRAVGRTCGHPDLHLTALASAATTDVTFSCDLNTSGSAVGIVRFCLCLCFASVFFFCCHK